jgi:hypothetical protein
MTFHNKVTNTHINFHSPVVSFIVLFYTDVIIQCILWYPKRLIFKSGKIAEKNKHKNHLRSNNHGVYTVVARCIPNILEAMVL